MKIKNIYSDALLRYPLTSNEISKIDKVWEFSELFNKEFIFIADYRRYLIKKISSTYTLDEFYELESILNKLFWNIRWLLMPIWLNINIKEDDYIKELNNNLVNLPNALTLCSCESYNDNLSDKLKTNSVYESTYYRSFINKLIIVDTNNKVIYTKHMEGGSYIFGKNYFNLLTMYILKNRELYEKVVKNPLIIQESNFELPNHYYQYDYAFPNLNFCVYMFGDDKIRKERIKKMYYTDNKGKEWFKLIT